MDLLVIFNILRKRLWILITIPVIIVIVTFFLTSKLPVYYKSTAQLATGFTTQGKIQVTEESINLREASVKFSNLIETMNSEVVLTLLSYDLLINDLKENPFRQPQSNSFTDSLSFEDKQKYLALIESKYEKMQVLSAYNQADKEIMEMLSDRSYLGWQLKDNLSIFRVRDTDFVKIQFLSENPFLSAFIVNSIGKNYIKYENSLKHNFSGESVDFFAKQMSEKKSILDSKTDAYDQFIKSLGAYSYNGTENDSKLSQISQYELLVQNGVADVQRLRLSIENINEKLEQVPGVDQASINKKIVEIRDKINELTNLYQSSGSSDTTLAKSIRKLRYDLQIEMDKLSASNNTVPGSSKNRDQLLSEREDLQLQLRIAQQNLSSVKANLATLKASISGYASNEADLMALKKEMEKAEEDYNKAEERYNRELAKAKVSETSVRLVIQGQPSGNPESSKRILFILMAGAGSFGFCAFIIVALELLDMRLKSPNQFKKITNLELAGTIPHIAVKGLELANLFNNQSQDKDKETFKHFLRKLRYEIEKDSRQVYLITSNKRGEGKSFIILCLAFTLGLLKKKILIIDTNFKNNSLTRVLLQSSNNKRIEKGRYLLPMKDQDHQSESDDDDFANSIVSSTPHKQVFIIGNTGEQASPSEVFAGKDFDKMISQLRSYYDYIFLEGPALNEFPDTQELVSYVDKVIPLFASESTIKQMDRESLNYLKGLDEKLMGSILNNVDLANLKY